MQLGLVVIDLEMPRRQKRILAGAIAAAVVGGCAAIALASPPTTFVANQTLTAADLNASFASLDSRLSTLEKKPSRVSVRGISTFSVPATTFVRVPYKTKVFDDLAEFDSTAGAFAAGEAGDYEVCASLNSLTGSSGVGLELNLFINGSQSVAIGSGGTTGAVEGCHVERLAAGDQVDVRLYASSAISIGPDDNWDWLTIVKL